MANIIVNGLEKFICIKDYYSYNNQARKGEIYYFETSIIFSESSELFYKTRGINHSISEWKFILHFEKLSENRRRKIEKLINEKM